MYAIEMEETRHANAMGTEPPQVRLHFKRGPDCRRYNEPSHDEVAAIFIGEDGAPPENRDIIVYPRGTTPQRISYLSCLCVILFCFLEVIQVGTMVWFIQWSTEHHPETNSPCSNSMDTD